MEAKLYVGNLPYTTSEDELRALFAQAGTVKSVIVIKDRETGRSKGFGFVEMSTAEEAQTAISKFNASKLQNRPLTVNIARPREETPRGGASGKRSGERSRSGGGRRNDEV